MCPSLAPSKTKSSARRLYEMDAFQARACPAPSTRPCICVGGYERPARHRLAARASSPPPCKAPAPAAKPVLHAGKLRQRPFHGRQAGYLPQLRQYVRLRPLASRPPRLSAPTSCYQVVSAHNSPKQSYNKKRPCRKAGALFVIPKYQSAASRLICKIGS